MDLETAIEQVKGKRLFRLRGQPRAGRHSTGLETTVASTDHSSGSETTMIDESCNNRSSNLIFANRLRSSSTMRSRFSDFTVEFPEIWPTMGVSCNNADNKHHIGAQPLCLGSATFPAKVLRDGRVEEAEAQKCQSMNPPQPVHCRSMPYREKNACNESSLIPGIKCKTTMPATWAKCMQETELW